jgi:hypothetical protein
MKKTSSLIPILNTTQPCMADLVVCNVVRPLVFNGKVMKQVILHVLVSTVKS